MKSIHIFKKGTHTSAQGITLDFNEDLLQGAAAAYDASLHEAPIVIGHPTSNGPAFGWISKLEYSDGNIHAIPHQVNADFQEMVQQGAFKKVSASWYLPDSPQNPKPGTLYLRHVGFLGAQPPAIKGLSGINFNEATDGVVEFEEPWQDGWNISTIAGVFKRLREFVIDKFSRDEADALVPDYVIDDLNRSAERKMNPPEPAFPTNYEENDPMKIEELQQQLADAQAQLAAVTAERDAAQGRVAQFEEAQKAARKAEIESQIDSLIAAGKVLPGNRAQALAFAESLDASGMTAEFGEGDQKQALTGSAAFIAFLQGQKSAVDFSEKAGDDKEPEQEETAQTLAQKAVNYQEEQRKAGRVIDIATAVNEVSKQAE